MKNLFAKMSFPRLVILVCSFGSLVLGVLVFLRARRLEEVKSELRRVPEIVREIQSDAYHLSDLKASESAEKFKAQSEPETYIRAISGDDKINMGQIDIVKTTKSPAKGIEDDIYKMTPQTKSQRYMRGQIGNFLFKLEKDSRRVKITRLKLWPFEKVAPGEVGKDQWNFEAELTTRTKLEAEPGPQG